MIYTSEVQSIGTIIASAYAAKNGLNFVRHVLYTPLKYTYMYKPGRAIAFIGTNDAWGDYREVVALSEKAGIPIRVYENCNHSLEVENDAEGNMERLMDIMKNTKEFISEK